MIISNLYLTNRNIIPDRKAAMRGFPTITISHFMINVFLGIYGFKSSVPGIVHAYSIMDTICNDHNTWQE